MDYVTMEGDQEIILYLSHIKEYTKVSNKQSEDSHEEKLKLSVLSHSFNNITILEITNCDMGKIPNSIQHLNLKQLLLSYNKLPEVPTLLYSGLSCLEVLDLSFNLIQDFDTQPACHNSIKTLNISNNKIKNFPYWLLMMPCQNLEQVYYSNNYLRQLKCNREINLRELEMKNCGAIDEDFVCLKSLKNLEKLDLSNERPTNNENRFKELKNLFICNKWKGLLHFALNNLTLALLPTELFSIVSLQELYLIKCELSWIPDEISNLKNLRVLDVSENSISSLPETLTNLENLQIVRASSNYISVVDDFCNDLEILDLFGNILKSFHTSIQVKYIDLEENEFDTSQCDNYESYKIKRDNFRKLFDLKRKVGPVEPEVDTYSIESHLSDEESYVFESPEENYKKIEHFEDTWDDYYSPVKQLQQKNPDVTPSDDEWDANIEIKRNTNKKKKLLFNLYDENEDVIFADAEQ